MPLYAHVGRHAVSTPSHNIGPGDPPVELAEDEAAPLVALGQLRPLPAPARGARRTPTPIETAEPAGQTEES